MTTLNKIKINVYRAGGDWYYSCWSNGEFDHSDTLDIDGDASDEAAIAAAVAMPLISDGVRDVQRVADSE